VERQSLGLGSHRHLRAVLKRSTATPYAVTVTFSGNGSTGGSMAAETASVATNFTTNAFTRTCYDFAGWNTVANGTGTRFAHFSDELAAGSRPSDGYIGCL
jgi:hypothetical protein